MNLRLYSPIQLRPDPCGLFKQISPLALTASSHSVYGIYLRVVPSLDLRGTSFRACSSIDSFCCAEKLRVSQLSATF